MSLNAYFAFAVAKGTGVSRQIVLAAVFCSGILFLILSFLPVRAWIISSIPRSQKLATATGISLFLGFIGLKSAGIVADHPATFVTVGKLTSPPDLLAFLSLIIIIELDFRKITGSIIIGILLVAIAGFLLAVSPAPSGIISAPPSIAPTFLAIDINGLFQLGATTIMIVVLSFLLVDLFDTAGPLIGVAYQAKMLGAQDNLPRLEPALIADSRATVIGILVSTSSTTSYIESASGARAGGRTRLTAVAAACLFILALLFAPLATAIPPYATPPAIVFVTCIMAGGLAYIDWEDVTEYTPGVITALSMPLMISIATGIGLGFVSNVAIKLVCGRIGDISAAMWLIAVTFVLYFATV